jgi:hypothetical protein
MPVTFQQSAARAFVESPLRERNQPGAGRSVWAHFRWPGVPKNRPQYGDQPRYWSDDGLHYLETHFRLYSLDYFEMGALYISRKFREYQASYHPYFDFSGTAYKRTIRTSCDGLIYSFEVLDDGTQVESDDPRNAENHALACTMLDRFNAFVSAVPIRIEDPSPTVHREVYLFDPSGRPVFPASPTADSEFITADDTNYSADSEGVPSPPTFGLLEIVYEWEVSKPVSWEDSRGTSFDLLKRADFPTSQEFLVLNSVPVFQSPAGPNLVTGTIRRMRPGEEWGLEWLRYKNPFPDRREFDADKMPPAIVIGPWLGGNAVLERLNWPFNSDKPVGKTSVAAILGRERRAETIIEARGRFHDLQKTFEPNTGDARLIEEYAYPLDADGVPIFPPSLKSSRSPAEFAVLCSRYRAIISGRQFHPDCIATPFGAVLHLTPAADSPLWP